ncbi:hypothetical protein [Amnibacterium setariae]|nr:hypothetical protein [Amnibacterium setariae]
MPSYRVVLTVGRVHPGGNAQAVLPAAANAVGALTTVEAKSVGVRQGRAEATVRFEAVDDEIAKQIAPVAAQSAGAHAEILEVALRRQNGTRWPLVA